MQTNLKWKKGLFSNCYSIYSDGQLIGKLNDNSFSQSANGELNGKRYNFKTKGFIKQKTQILEASSNKVIGEITFDNWMTKADITLLDKKAKLKYDNLWNTKWRIFDSEGLEIKFTGCSNGQIDSNTDDPLLLLSGLFVSNYYMQMTVVVLVAIFIPIWTTISF